MKSLKSIYIIALGAIAFLACKTIPEGATPVKNFQKEKYLGKWYEIARMDFKFEENLNNTTAQYALKESGKIRVYNKGYNYVKNKWEDATGKAKFVKDEEIGMLKVSFFGPFYSGYNVIAIDENYRHALIAGKNLEYLWILSRETSISGEVKDQYLKIAQEIGYNTDELIWVEHDQAER